MADKSKSLKKKKKDTQLIVRVSGGEREAFVDLCEKMDTSASREIRRFMREFVAANRADAKKQD